MTERALDGIDLRASLAEAQQGLLAAASTGRAVDQVWLLPPGAHTIHGTLDLGAAGVSLTLRGQGTSRGQRTSRGQSTSRGQGTSISVVPAPGTTGQVNALSLRGRAVVLEGVTVTCAPVAADLVGVRLEGTVRAAAREVRVRGVHAETSTGVQATAPRVELAGVRAADVVATTGIATGVQVTALDGPGDETDGRIAAERIAVDGVRGPQVRGVAVDASRGTVTDVTVTGLVPTAAGGLDEALQVTGGVDVARVAIERAVPVADGAQLLVWLQAAQQQLAAAPEGTSETWRLPAGTFTLDAGLQLGASGRDLAVSGTSEAGGGTELVFGATTPVAGDLVGVEVTGARVQLRELTVRARATGALFGVSVSGETSARLSDLQVLDLRGAEVFGINVFAPDAGLAGVGVHGVRATGTADTTLAVGIAATGDRVTASRVTVTQVNGPVATGLGVTAAERAEVALLRIAGIGGGNPEGAHFRVVGRPGTHRELALLDARVQDIRGVAIPGSATPTGAAVGVQAYCSGDIAWRGVSVAAVEGVEAYGLLAVAAGELDWLGGTVTDVRGTTRGAAGARLFAVPSRSRISVRDVQVEAVRAPAVAATAVGHFAVPSPSWRAWLERIRPWVGDGDGPGPPGQFASADPAHVDEVTGLHVCAPVEESEPWLESAGPGPDTDAGEVLVAQCVVRRVSGSAVQVEADLRDVELRGVETWTAVRGGHLTGERVLLAQLTWHRMQTGLELGPCTLTAANSLLTGVVTGPGLVPGPDTDVDQVIATFSAGSPPPFAPPPADPLYAVAGPAGIPPTVLEGALAPVAAVDLRLADPSRHGLARRVPGDGDGVPVFLGAHPPEADSRCDLRDPAPPARPEPPPQPPPGPPVDYRARDARSLLAVMTDRARRVMPGWAPTGPADQTTMWLELLAARLDQVAYRQEVAVAEGYLGTAQARRSVEDHARLVDYRPDPGLSATAMVRFTLDAAGAAALDLTGHLAQAGAVVVPAGTLVVNPDATDRLVVFATEADLALDPGLDVLRLAEPVDAGATSAVLAEDLTALEAGRWLVLLANDAEDPELADPDTAPHVVRVTRVELGVDTTRVFWDPRRRAPARYEPGTCAVLGNVVPAHHGLPLTPLSAQGPGAVLDTQDLLRPWRERLTVRVTGGDTREVGLPWQPVSVHAAGWPLPGGVLAGGVPRAGVVQVRLSVDGEPWTLVDDLSTLGPGEESFVLRPGHAGGVAAVVGDGVNGAGLPDREVAVEFGVRIGLGMVGNVAAGTLVRLLALGEGGDADLLLGAGDADRFDLLRRHVRVTNPLPATGGRDPEPLERIRYAAPLGVRDLLSAVVPADYERLVGELPEVAAARARVRTDAPRPVIRVTLLLRDEDSLAAGGAAGEAERLRRWALARARLESVRLLGFDVELVPPRFVPLDVDLVVDAAPWASAESVRAGVTVALAGQGGLLDPDTTGLGGDVHLDAVHRRVLGVPGVIAVRARRLRRLQPGAVDPVADGVLPVGTDEVAVLRHPYGPDHAQGLLTVEVCGGLP